MVNLCFEPPICKNLLGELTQLWRIGTVADYIDQLLILLSRAGPLLPEQQIQLFTVGLQELGDGHEPRSVLRVTCTGHRRLPGGRADIQAIQGVTTLVNWDDNQGRTEGQATVCIELFRNGDRRGRKNTMDSATHTDADGET